MSDISKNRVAAVLLIPWLLALEFILFRSFFIALGLLFCLSAFVRTKVQWVLFKDYEHPLTASIFFIFAFGLVGLFFGSITEGLLIFGGGCLAIISIDATYRLWKGETTQTAQRKR